MFISSGLCRRSPEISLEIARDVVRSVDTGYEPHLTARWRATSNAPADQAGGLLRAGDVATHRACRGATKWVQILARGARQRTSKSGWRLTCSQASALSDELAAVDEAASCHRERGRAQRVRSRDWVGGSGRFKMRDPLTQGTRERWA